VFDKNTNQKSFDKALETELKGAPFRVGGSKHKVSQN
jgi:hypothetical protein